MKWSDWTKFTTIVQLTLEFVEEIAFVPFHLKVGQTIIVIILLHYSRREPGHEWSPAYFRVHGYQLVVYVIDHLTNLCLGQPS